MKLSRAKKPFLTLLVLSCLLIVLGYSIYNLNEDPDAERALRNGATGDLAEEYLHDRNYARYWSCGIALTGLTGAAVSIWFLMKR